MSSCACIDSAIVGWFGVRSILFGGSSRSGPPEKRLPATARAAKAAARGQASAMSRESILKDIGQVNVAVIHDWLTGMRGGEVVLEAILDLFPEADLYTLLHNEGSVSEKIARRRIVTSFVDRLPFKKTRYRHYLPLFPTAIESFDLHGYDLVISSSHCVARGVIVPPGVPHLSYLHSPMRYVWDMYQEYFPRTGFANRFVIPFFANYLRMWDAAATPRVDRYTCNSAFVAERIRRYYGARATVIHPPCIESEKSVQPGKKRDDFYLVVSALVPYKRIDLAIDAFRDLDRRLVIVGTGPEERRLKAHAPTNVEFAGRLERAQIQELYGRARALIFPGEEDFGIVPVEAQARGCPVIAYARGGALETVRRNRTGVFFDEQNAGALRRAVQDSEQKNFPVRNFRENARRFTRAAFQRKLVHDAFRT